MKILDEFKKFAVKGNMMDMAVGIIIGAAFGKIVSSLVSDIIMPPIGLLLGGVNFADLKVVMKAAKDNSVAIKQIAKKISIIDDKLFITKLRNIKLIKGD